MMKIFLLLALLASCSHENVKKESPHWVAGIRSGEESLKVAHGNKMFYRRIAGGKNISKQTSCELVVMKAEEDIKKEYPLLPKVPYNVEVLFYDEDYQDCAVTLSVSARLSEQQDELTKIHEIALMHRDELFAKDNVTADEAAEILVLRSEMAIEYAFTGVTKNEYEKYIHQAVVLNEGASLCSPVFFTNTFSIHGTTHLCWEADTVKGYCTVKDKVCWRRTP